MRGRRLGSGPRTDTSLRDEHGRPINVSAVPGDPLSPARLEHALRILARLIVRSCNEAGFNIVKRLNSSRRPT